MQNRIWTYIVSLTCLINSCQRPPLHNTCRIYIDTFKCSIYIYSATCKYNFKFQWCRNSLFVSHKGVSDMTKYCVMRDTPVSKTLTLFCIRLSTAIAILNTDFFVFSSLSILSRFCSYLKSTSRFVRKYKGAFHTI